MYKLANGTSIRYYEDMCDYFDYEQIRRIIRGEDAAYILDDIAEIMEANGASFLKIIGTAEPQKLDVCKTILIKENTGRDFLYSFFAKVDVKNLNLFPRRLGGKSFVLPKELQDVLSFPLTTKQIKELIHFYALFAYVKRVPSDKDFTLLQSCMELDSPEVILPCFQQQPSGQAPELKLSLLRNPLDTNLLLCLDSCSLQQVLPAGKEIAALTADGQVVTFLQKDVCCALSSTGTEGSTVRFGLCETASSGEIRWLWDDPDNPFLSSDCACRDHFPKNWGNLLFCEFCAGGAIAVTDKREAIDLAGKVLSENAFAVSCYGQHWIILRTDGSVVTDQMEYRMPGVWDVQVNKDGYTFFSDEQPDHVNFDKEIWFPAEFQPRRMVFIGGVSNISEASEYFTIPPITARELEHALAQELIKIAILPDMEKVLCLGTHLLPGPFSLRTALSKEATRADLDYYERVISHWASGEGEKTLGSCLDMLTNPTILEKQIHPNCDLFDTYYDIVWHGCNLWFLENDVPQKVQTALAEQLRSLFPNLGQEIGFRVSLPKMTGPRWVCLRNYFPLNIHMFFDARNCPYDPGDINNTFDAAQRQEILQVYRSHREDLATGGKFDCGEDYQAEFTGIQEMYRDQLSLLEDILPLHIAIRGHLLCQIYDYLDSLPCYLAVSDGN